MRTREIDLSDLASADEVRVTDNLNLELDRVTDAAAIRRLGDWLGERQQEWYVPREGVHIASVRLTFYRGGQTMGSVGLSGEFLVAQRRGSFAQRDAEPRERAEALAILGVSDPEA